VTRLTSLTAALAIAAGLFTAAPAQAGDRGFCNLTTIHYMETANAVLLELSKWQNDENTAMTARDVQRANRDAATIHQIERKMAVFGRSFGVLIAHCADVLDYTALDHLRAAQQAMLAFAD
jgi:hypothetical protein